jgi:hypothetical protein
MRLQGPAAGLAPFFLQMLRDRAFRLNERSGGFLNPQPTFIGDPAAQPKY